MYFSHYLLNAPRISAAAAVDGELLPIIMQSYKLEAYSLFNCSAVQRIAIFLQGFLGAGALGKSPGQGSLFLALTFSPTAQWRRQLWGTGARAPPRLPTISY